MLNLELKLGEQTQDCEMKEIEQMEDLLLNSVDVFAVWPNIFGPAYHR